MEQQRIKKYQDETVISPLALKIKQKTWDDFKKIVPRTKTLNYAVVELIEKKVEEEKQ